MILKVGQKIKEGALVVFISISRNNTNAKKSCHI